MIRHEVDAADVEANRAAASFMLGPERFNEYWQSIVGEHWNSESIRDEHSAILESFARTPDSGTAEPESAPDDSG